jgi:hypothetical protein
MKILKGSAQMFEIETILKKQRNLIELQEQNQVGKPFSKDRDSTPGACVFHVLSFFEVTGRCSGCSSGGVLAGL